MSPLRLSEIVRRDLAVDPVITGVTADSRKVACGTLFAALPGAKADGRSFIAQALAAGRRRRAGGRGHAGRRRAGAACARRRAPGLCAGRRAPSGAPSRKVCVAVTGTNGKTSVANFCRQIWMRLGHLRRQHGHARRHGGRRAAHAARA